MIACLSSALGGDPDLSICDTFMSHLAAVTTAFSQAANMPSRISEDRAVCLRESQSGRTAVRLL